ncbi:MAG: response regulator [Phycisphaerales bacterium]|nr:MAG: response regulator [Phycisphaerales bacterium]
MTEPEIDILIVDDDEEIAIMVADHLEAALSDGTIDAPVTVRWATSARQAMDFFHARPADVLLADLALPDEDGLSMVRKMRHHAEPAILIITGNATLGKAIESMRLGACDMLIKPFDLRHLSDAVREAAKAQLARRREEVRRRRLHELASRIVRERRELRQRVDLVCHDLVGAYRNLAAKFAEQSIPANDEAP